MSRTLLLWLNGNFEQGFSVTLEWGTDGQPTSGRTEGRLESKPEIVQLYTKWQQRYRQLDYIYRQRLQEELEELEPTDDNIQEECHRYADTLRSSLNTWINSTADFSRVRDRLVAELNKEPDIRVLIQTSDPHTQRIPWHLWDLWQSYRTVEITLSNPYYYSQRQPTPYSRDKVRILAILGNNEGIDITKDRQYLEQLPGVDSSSLKILEEPERDEVFDWLEDAQGWDILFFAGHSSSENNGTTGRFYINRNPLPKRNNLTIEQLKYSLETAIQNGLKLAIFNSCDGLGLAHQLANLQIPQIIVMREPVPDDVAHTFLKYFLKSFSEGIPIQRAVKTARQRLRRLELELPYATWLPVLYQHPTVEPINPFLDLSPLPPPPSPPQPPNPRKNKLITLLLFMLFTSGLVLAILNIIKNNFTPPQPVESSDRVQERISYGEKYLFSTVTKEKDTGIEAIAKAEYDKAISALQADRNNNPNDPETLIYLNNAKINNQEPYTIAVSVPIGTDPNSSSEILRGIAQAQDEINQGGGIKDKRLKVAIANDDDAPEIAQQVAKALVKDSKVLGVVGHIASDATLKAGSIYDGKIVAISPTSTSIKLTNFSPYIFRTVPSDSVAAKELATYMIGEMRKKNAVVFFNSQSAYSQSLSSEFTASVKSLGGKVLNEFDLSNPSFNATNHVKEAIKQGAEVLMLAPNRSVLDKALQIAEANHKSKRLSLLGGDDVYAPEVLKGKQTVAGMVVAVPWDIGNNQSSNFAVESKKLWGNYDVNWRTAMSYDATKALIAAIERNPTRHGVQQVLAGSDFSAEGASGNIGFFEGDRLDAKIQLVKVVPAANSSNGYDFVPIEKVNTASRR